MNGFTDPETGKGLPTFNSREDAERAARARSKGIDAVLRRLGLIEGD